MSHPPVQGWSINVAVSALHIEAAVWNDDTPNNSTIFREEFSDYTADGDDDLSPAAQAIDACFEDIGFFIREEIARRTGASS